MSSQTFFAAIHPTELKAWTGEAFVSDFREWERHDEEADFANALLDLMIANVECRPCKVTLATVQVEDGKWAIRCQAEMVTISLPQA